MSKLKKTIKKWMGEKKRDQALEQHVNRDKRRKKNLIRKRSRRLNRIRSSK